MKTYEQLSLKEKADFLALMISLGLNDYFDTCEKKRNGYYYYCADGETTTRYSAKNLVAEMEEYHGKEELSSLWEERNNA